MRVYSATVAFLASLSPQTSVFTTAFAPSRVAPSSPWGINIHGANVQRQLTNTRLFSTSTEESEAAPSTATKKKKKLGLITFDLDDTLYPIAPGALCVHTIANPMMPR